MPVYNRELYLEQAVNSVLKQAFIDFELIIIDDCSTDNSINIIKKYQQKDKRIKTYFFKEKQKVSICRNKLLDLAAGQYILFLDSDDYYTSFDVLSFLKNKIDDETLLCFSMTDFNNETKEVKPTSFMTFVNQTIFYDDNMKLFRDFSHSRYSSSVCNKVFCRSVIKENKLLFPNSIEIGEDYLFLLQYCFFVKKVETLSNVFYERRVHQSLYETHKNFEYKFYNWMEQNLFFYIKSIELSLDNIIEMFTYLTFHRYIGTIRKHYFKTIKLFNNKIDSKLKNQMKQKYKESGLTKKERAFAKSYFNVFYRIFVFPITIVFYKLRGVR